MACKHSTLSREKFSFYFKKPFASTSTKEDSNNNNSSSNNNSNSNSSNRCNDDNIVTNATATAIATSTVTTSSTVVTEAPLLFPDPMSAAKSFPSFFNSPAIQKWGVDTQDHGKTYEAIRPPLPTPNNERQQNNGEVPDMRYEIDRLRSLERWPVNFIDKRLVARTGLYYFGEGDKVRCVFCNVELGEWEEGDDPAVDHERWRPRCPLLIGRAYSNVPLNSSSSNAATTNGNPPSAGVGQDVCGTFDANRPQQSQHEPVRPAFASEPTRLASFADWPCRMKQRPEVMADAGFFYTGSGDKTVCFHCGGGLKDWEDDDDPWEQHARWYPTCYYVNLVKGESFVKEIHSKSVERTDDDTVKNQPTTTTNSLQSLSLSSPAAKTAATSDTKLEVDISNKESSLCKICFSEERNICFVPCGHVVACPKCALAVQLCPVCRKKINSTMRLYYS